jgi:hypothetical protein
MRDPALFHKVVQEFGHRRDTGNQQVISGTGAGDVEQVTLGVIDFLQIGVVADRLDALLQGNYLVVTGHYGYGPELQAFREMHRADRGVAASGFDMFIENLECDSGRLCGGSRTIELCFGSDEHCEFVR